MTTMDTMEIANTLVELCRQGAYEEALALYASDAVSVEAGGPPDMAREVRGIEAIRGKGEWWTSNHEVHGMIVAGPWPHDDRFIVGFRIDATFKTSGERFTMEEMALYTVEDGKIVREEFFYAA
ncbi:nuclear transport factor 2 family protein [Variovorax sp. UC122_21]|uniref:nuclear transport factor 2 family protein n=1 Tax=Variovorax TaxID=34072 RepID=UPI001B6B198D